MADSGYWDIGSDQTLSFTLYDGDDELLLGATVTGNMFLGDSAGNTTGLKLITNDVTFTESTGVYAGVKPAALSLSYGLWYVWVLTVTGADASVAVLRDARKANYIRPISG